MSTQPKGSNGTAAPKPETNGTTKAVATVVNLKPSSQDDKGKDLPPLEDRLLRLDQLFDVRKKYDRYRSSLQKLNEFELKNQSESGRLSIYDESRNSFETSNPEIIREVIDFVKVKTAEKIKALEPKLSW